MKPFMKLAVPILSLFLLAGCWDRTELNDLALITALAMDTAKNNKVQVTAQIIIPQSQPGVGGAMGGGAGGGAPNRTITRTGKGVNISDALANLQLILPRKQFWGQCKIFIFEKAIAKKGIREQFDFLARHPQPRERAYMLVSRGKAADALELFPPIERSSGEVLRKLSDAQMGIQVTLEQLSILLKSDSESFVLPMVSILPKSKSSKPFETIPYIYRAAVFKKGKMIGEMSENTTRGVLCIQNGLRQATVTFKVKEPASGTISLQPVKAHVKLIPQIQGKKWMMTIRVRTEGTLVQNGTNVNPTNPDLLKGLNKAFEHEITRMIQLALNDAQHRLKADIFNFAREFHRKYPRHWHKVRHRWNKRFPDVIVHIDTKAQIIRSGLINAPGGITEEEVKIK